MRNFLLSCTLLLSCVAHAADKPILDAATAARFKQVVAQLDGYRGDTAMLATVNADLNEIIKAYPKFAPAYREQARYFIIAGSIGSASGFRPNFLETADFLIGQALAADPNFAEAYVLRGHLYRLMGRRDDAKAALIKAEQLGTADPWLHNNWADLLIEDKNYAAAIQRYQKVVDSKTPNRKAMSAALIGLSRCYEDLGQLDQVEETHKKLIALEPGTAWHYEGYAQFLLCKRDDYEKSIALSRQGLAIMDYGVGRFWLAAGLYRKWAQSVVDGKPDAGGKSLQEAQVLYPNVDEVAGYARSCPPFRVVGQALARSRSVADPTAAKPATGGRL